MIILTLENIISNNRIFSILNRIASANHPQSPDVLWRGIFHFMKSKITHKPSLKYIDMALNYSCNMKCSHCFANSLKDTTKTLLSIDEIRNIVIDARKLGCLHINLQGGEPFLLHNLEDYIWAVNPNKMHISITTNGSFYNEDWAKRLIKCRVKQLVFSIDYLNASEHDRFRHSEGAYNKVIKSIEHAIKYGFSVTVNVTVSHQSLKEQSQLDLFNWLHEHKIYYNPILACAVGAWSENKECMVNEDDLQFINLLQKKGFAQRDIDASWVKKGCSATAEQLYITPYGDVMPCPFIQISLGSLKKKPLSNIWNESMIKGLHGHYNDRCWVAQDHHFADDLNNLYSNFKILPVPYSSSEGINFLNEHWK